MSRPALGGDDGLHYEPGVPREEMILCDIVQSFDARDLRPTSSGAGYGGCVACAITALVDHDTYDDVYSTGNYRGVSFAAANGWDNRCFNPPPLFLGYDDYTAGFAAWEAMHTTAEEAEGGPPGGGQPEDGGP